MKKSTKSPNKKKNKSLCIAPQTLNGDVAQWTAWLVTLTGASLKSGIPGCYCSTLPWPII